MHKYCTLRHSLWPKNCYLFLVIEEMETFCESLKYHRPCIVSPDEPFILSGVLWCFLCLGYPNTRWLCGARPGSTHASANSEVFVIMVLKAGHTQPLSCGHLCCTMTFPWEMWANTKSPQKGHHSRLRKTLHSLMLATGTGSWLRLLTGTPQ